MKEVIAVFDIGKTNKKVLLFDQNFSVVYQQEEQFPTIVDDDGFECDYIELISQWIKNTLMKLSSTPAYKLVGVNFSTYGASLMFLDENGEALTPLYNYLKPVSPSIAEELFAQYGGKNEFCRKTASPALGLLLNSGIQILWLKKEKPQLFNRVKTILHFPQYLTYTLTGAICSEPTSIGCHTFMWDFDHMRYHPWLKDHNIELPEPDSNDKMFDYEPEKGKLLKVGVGIHDSSASLVPYLKASTQKFILVSTGTWCINMNPFNNEPLTTWQLEQDCLCFLTPNLAQVKSSRLFMGHFHEVWAQKLADKFKVPVNSFKTVKNNPELIDQMQKKFEKPIFFPNGKESFEDGLKTADLGQFRNYEEAYTQLMIELTFLCAQAIKLIIPQKDETELLYVSGGFARNPIFLYLLKKYFDNKQVLISEIDNASALGAAMVIDKAFSNSESEKFNLKLSE